MKGGNKKKKSLLIESRDGRLGLLPGWSRPEDRVPGKGHLPRVRVPALRRRGGGDGGRRRGGGEGDREDARGLGGDRGAGRGQENVPCGARPDRAARGMGHATSAHSGRPSRLATPAALLHGSSIYLDMVLG